MVHHCDVNKSANTLLGSRRRRLVFIPTSFSHQPLIELWVLPPPYLSHEYCERLFWSVIPLKIRGNLFWASDIIGDRDTISKPTKPCFDLSELLGNIEETWWAGENGTQMQNRPQHVFGSSCSVRFILRERRGSVALIQLSPQPCLHIQPDISNALSELFGGNFVSWMGEWH